MTTPLPPAAWYSDPADSQCLRYWDGGRWTDHVSRYGVVGVEPLDATVAPTVTTTLPAPYLPTPHGAPLPVAFDVSRPAAMPYGAGPVYASPWLRFGSFLLEGLLVAVLLGIGWLVWALVVVGDGRTPAKRLLGLQVIDATTGRPAGFLTMFLIRGLVGRVLVGLASTFTLGIILFMPFWDSRNRNLWDRISGTVVVKAS